MLVLFHADTAGASHIPCLYHQDNMPEAALLLLLHHPAHWLKPLLQCFNSTAPTACTCTDSVEARLISSKGTQHTTINKDYIFRTRCHAPQASDSRWLHKMHLKRKFRSGSDEDSFWIDSLTTLHYAHVAIYCRLLRKSHA